MLYSYRSGEFKLVYNSPEKIKKYANSETAEMQGKEKPLNVKPKQLNSQLFPTQMQPTSDKNLSPHHEDSSQYLMKWIA